MPIALRASIEWKAALAAETAGDGRPGPAALTGVQRCELDESTESEYVGEGWMPLLLPLVPLLLLLLLRVVVSGAKATVVVDDSMPSWSEVVRGRG